MAESPSVVVTESLPSSPKSKKAFLVIVIILAVAAILITAYYFRSSKVTQTPTPAPKTPTQSNIHQKRDIKGDLERQLKLTFSSTKYFEDINLYMQQGSKAKTTPDAYANYLKAYQFASQAYTDSKNSEYKTVLFQFRDFLKAFPLYKDSEVVIPK